MLAPQFFSIENQFLEGDDSPADTLSSDTRQLLPPYSPSSWSLVSTPSKAKDPDLLSMASLPYAADAESPLKPEELKVLRDQYEKEGNFVGVQTKFNYAWSIQGLIKSLARGEQQEGVRLLSEIYRQAPERRRECLYYLGLGEYKLGNYAEARRYNDSLLSIEPGNLQASSLRDLIEDKVQKEGLVGVAIVGGLAVAAGLVGTLVMRGMKKR